MHEVLKAARTERDRADLGDYFAISSSKNHAVRDHIDLEKLARDLGALREWETVDAP